MDIQKLENYAEQCLAKNQPMQLLIEMPGFNAPELQVNPVENIEKKMEYIRATYNDNCEHKHAQGIRIVDIVYDEEISQGVTILPAVIPQGQVRYSQSTYVGDASKDIVIEGSVENVIKVYQSLQNEIHAASK